MAAPSKTASRTFVLTLAALLLAGGACVGGDERPILAPGAGEDDPVYQFCTDPAPPCPPPLFPECIDLEWTCLRPDAPGP
jgi:hypothetical protein